MLMNRLSVRVSSGDLGAGPELLVAGAERSYEFQGDLRRGRFSPNFIEWTQDIGGPWTFIVNKEGLIHAKFEALATRDELEQALAGVVE